MSFKELRVGDICPELEPALSVGVAKPIVCHHGAAGTLTTRLRRPASLAQVFGVPVDNIFWLTESPASESAGSGKRALPTPRGR